jgi:ribosomal protein S18 acetylase RimI-like enzyme
VIAYEMGTLEPVGAAWLRVFVGTEKGCDSIVDGTPELAIATLPSCTGKGIGSQLLTQLLATASLSYPAIYLSVRATNPAKRLYERFGFTVIGELTNRIGGQSFHMVKAFSRPVTESAIGK